MAGVNSNDVYLLGPDQSTTTGAMKKGAIGASAPTDARTQLGTGWSDAAGYISENGITLTGGCSQIWGMDLLLMERTGIACILADDPDSCTAYGAGKSLAWINNMQEGPINIARKRAMKSGL